MAELRLDEIVDRTRREAGEPAGDVVRRDLVAGLGQQFGIDIGGNDFGIDEHTVAVESKKHRVFQAPRGRRS